MKGKNDSFIIIHDGLRLLITPDSGWYAVQGLDIRGLNTQGRTIEEAIYMAHDAAKALANARAMLAKRTAKEKKIAEKERTAKTRRTPRRRQAVGAREE